MVALAVPVTLVLADAERRNGEVAAAASEPIEGEQVVEVPSAAHVTTDVPDGAAPTVAVAEGRLPPLGGDHDPTVQNCGVYVEPVRDENAVHSLEHGAVWITYRPDIDAGQVQRLGELAAAEPYLLVSPYEDLTAPVVATAWGVQLELDSVADERLEAFIERYAQGEQTPEPGAPCSGGIGG
ncbi:hypothetical protein N868_13130 [Cellulomonas carbonis T26]|uniref:DUF3105 domain-containing protein n=1 Tax=Cellulomonas carbonis T26 TaxID=947969 RepID=A0A0A0BR26_9CELL|nr:hypothetical protein N868_13130 [Cellulomonas carbonis T26]